MNNKYKYRGNFKVSIWYIVIVEFILLLYILVVYIYVNGYVIFLECEEGR